jgi:lipopolysaccharide biosynthesis glycosyltransferase
MNILYTTDNNYAKYTLVSIYSLLMNNPNEKFTIYLIGHQLTNNFFNKLELILKEFNNGTYIYYEDNKICNLLNKLNIPLWRETHVANDRLFFQEIIPNNVEEIIYLDSDTLIIGNIDKLPLYLKDKPLYAVRDLCSIKYLYRLNKRITVYFNSGVLLINSKLWQEENCQEKIIKMANEYHSKLKFPDQDLLNLGLHNRIGTLPINYNLMAINYFFNKQELKKFIDAKNSYYYSNKDINLGMNDPKIIHGAECYKTRPWDNKSINPYAYIYSTYMQKVFPELFINYIPKGYNDIIYIKLCNYLKINLNEDFYDTLKRVIKKC